MLETPFVIDVGRSDRICRADCWATLSDLKAIATIGNVGLISVQSLESGVFLYIVVVSVSQSSITPQRRSPRVCQLSDRNKPTCRGCPAATRRFEMLLPALSSSTNEIELMVAKCVINDQRFPVHMFAIFVVKLMLMLTSLPG